MAGTWGTRWQLLPSAMVVSPLWMRTCQSPRSLAITGGHSGSQSHTEGPQTSRPEATGCVVSGSMSPDPAELTLAIKMHIDGEHGRGGLCPGRSRVSPGPHGKLGTLWPEVTWVMCRGHIWGQSVSRRGRPSSGEQESLGRAPEGPLRVQGSRGRDPTPLRSSCICPPGGDPTLLLSPGRWRHLHKSRELVSMPRCPGPTVASQQTPSPRPTKAATLNMPGVFVPPERVFSNDVGHEGLSCPYGSFPRRAGPFLSTSCDFRLPLCPPGDSGVGVVPWGWQRDRHQPP